LESAISLALVAAVPRFAVSTRLGLKGRVAVTTVRPVKDWACGKTHVTVVVPLDEIAAVFAALQTKSAVGRYVVP
jgi:hypothetical protein